VVLVDLIRLSTGRVEAIFEALSELKFEACCKHNMELLWLIGVNYAFELGCT